MPKSMTAFGSNRIEISGKTYLMEIQSVNKKQLEINIQLPRHLSFAEISLRKKISTEAKRGTLFFKLFADKSAKEWISLEECKTIHKRFVEIASSLDSKYEVTFDQVLSWVGKSELFSDLDPTFILGALEEGLKGAMDEWNAMRLEEGKVLASDILMRIATIYDSLDKIESMKEKAPQKYREKILERLDEIKKVDDDDRDRIVREVTIYAEKLDITEEIVRLKSHLAQLEKLITSHKEVAIGRTLDFLVMEMVRETNTISSKSSDIEIIQKALAIKGEIEKIKEQVQNIE